MDSSIIDLIIADVDSLLVTDMQAFIDASDITKAGLVRAGLLQDDPTAYGISVLTHPNDPDVESGWDHADAIITMGGGNFSIPGYEVGNGELWFYRFTTELIQFWQPSIVRTDAEKYSNVVLQRALYSLKRLPMTQTDSFGNSSHAVYVSLVRNQEGGGPNAFNWRGKIRWQVLVSTQ